LAQIVYHLVRFGMAYVKQTEAAYAEQMGDVKSGSCSVVRGSWVMS
jgi:hypothetical protein